MTNIITEIMVEVLRVFGIATKELRRGSTSESRIGYLRMFTKGCVEKFLRKLAGIADLEDALKKLDLLTQEEARMALAEVLRITHNVRDELQCVDEKVQVIIDGARVVSTQPPIRSNVYNFRRQGSKSSSAGSKIDYSKGGKRDRRSQVYVTSFI